MEEFLISFLAAGAMDFLERDAVGEAADRGYGYRPDRGNEDGLEATNAFLDFLEERAGEPGRYASELEARLRAETA